MDPIQLQAISGLIAMLAFACVGAAIIGVRDRKRAERRRYCLPPHVDMRKSVKPIQRRAN